MNANMSSPGLTLGWLRSNFFYGLISAVAGMAVFALEPALGAALAFNIETALALALAIALYAVAGGWGALLVGRVLRDVLPGMPLRAWVIWHGAMTALAGLSLVVFKVPPGGERLMPPSVAPLIVASALVVGVLAGAVFGAFQALILRRGARGLAGWIASSALGFAIVLVALVFIDDVWPANSGSVADELIIQTEIVLNFVAIALVMLPAVRRLRPR